MISMYEDCKYALKMANQKGQQDYSGLKGVAKFAGFAFLAFFLYAAVLGMLLPVIAPTYGLSTLFEFAFLSTATLFGVSSFIAWFFEIFGKKGSVIGQANAFLMAFLMSTQVQLIAVGVILILSAIGIADYEWYGFIESVGFFAYGVFGYLAIKETQEGTPLQSLSAIYSMGILWALAERDFDAAVFILALVALVMSFEAKSAANRNEV